ncbi:MAG: phage regulatory CII family protein [Gammaproteobacteria bacterium]|nr:phage regulatory CII family protein [Gammaproteobacteria bacterium]
MKHEVPVSPFAAFRAVATTYGVKDLADVLSMKPGTLWNKVDADVESHHQPTMRDVIAITRETQDFRILESMNRLFDRATIDLRPGPVSDEAVLELLLRVSSEKGQMAQALRKGYADARFCRDDYQAVRAEAFDLINAVLDFVQRLEGLVDE